MYLVMIIALFVVLPVASIVITWIVRPGLRHLPPLVGMWFTFWAVGVRLFTAGLNQAVNPAYTAQSIFEISDPVVLPFVQELGFANIAMGAVALVSLFLATWRPAAATVGAIYFGLAGFRHLIAGGDFSELRIIAMVSDLLIFVLLSIYLADAAARALRARRTVAPQP
jgi:hypothetical protein